MKLELSQVLIIDDNIAHIKAINALLKTAFASLQIKGEKKLAWFTNPDGLVDWLNLPTQVSGQIVHPDIIFLDITFDTVYSLADGYETIKKLRVHPKTQESFVVACTGNATNREDCISRGFSEFMRKPPTLDKIQDVLKRFAEVRNANTGIG